MTDTADLDTQCVNLLRFLAVDMVQNADSGHPGLPLGAAPMAYALWQHRLKHDPAKPLWPDRDRFVLSAGHGSALLYALLHVTGYGLTLDDLRQFRQWGSKTPGHPERGHTAGIEITTGPLGQGLANAVGMAIAEAHLAGRYNREGHVVVDHRTWVIASDGDLMEGLTAEACSLAGHLKLGKLCVLYDNNSVTLSSATDITFSEDRGARYAAYGWNVLSVEDGNDLAALNTALNAAVAETTRPTFIAVKTHLGFGSPLVDTFKAHGSPLGAENVGKTKETLGWPTEPAFFEPPEALARFRDALARGELAESDWSARFKAYAEAEPALAAELQSRFRDELPTGWDADIPTFEKDDKGVSTRVAGGKVMNAIAARLPALIGGSADLDPSTFTDLKGQGEFNPPSEGEAGAAPGHTSWSYAGRNLHFGVREHAMGAIANGMAAHGGVIGYGSTFLVFSDYMRPPIRLAALMGLHVVHVFTHDSLALGEDGPTHQPIEQLAALRAIPRLTVLRPGDANETAVAWRVAIETRDRPVLLVLSRQNLPTLDRTRYAAAEGVRRGAYVLSDPADGRPPAIALIATGSEVQLIVDAAEMLAKDGIAVRLVSMPSWELFAQQPEAYRDGVLPPSLTARLAVEAGIAQGWERWVGAGGDVLAIEDRFGASAPAKVVMEKYGYTAANVAERAQKLLGR